MYLYDLTDQYLKLLDAIDAGKIPDEAIEDTLAGIEGEIDEKIDSLACIVKELNAEASAIREEEKTLAERRKAKENKAERLKDYIRQSMEASGKQKVETARNRVRIGKPSVRVCVTSLPLLKSNPNFWKPYDYRESNLDKAGIKSLLLEGNQIPGAELVAGPPSLTIK